MEVPDLLGHRLDAEPRNGVALDGEDVAVVTRDRTFIYREEGLLSDAAVEVYSNDIERLSLSQGRRKTTFHLTYLDDTRQFSVANSHAEAMLEGLFDGLLASAGVLEDDEELRGVYLFSDLTLVVTDARLVKHIGASVWDTDSETYPFEAVTGLDFEDGEVATQVVLEVEGRAERIKAPSEEAPLLRRTLTEALCAFHGVDSLDRLNEVVGTDADDTVSHSSLALEEAISPLIETSDDSPAERTGTDTVDAVTDDDWLEPSATDSRAVDTAVSAADTGLHTARQAGDRTPERTVGAGDAGESADDTTAGDAGRRADDTTGADVETLERRVRELTRAVDRQSELLDRQAERLAELAERIDAE